jgi:type I restriction enzyme, S subunit
VNNWNNGILGDFITLQRGFDLPAYDRHSGNVPVVTSAGISDFHNEAKVKAPGVAMGRYGTIGAIYFIREDFWPHNTTLYVKDFKGNDPHFVSYFLRTLNYQAHNDKSSVPGLNRNHLHLIPVTFPPLPEQRTIAEVLGALDDKIEINRRTNVTLESMARAVFRQWFVENPDSTRWKLSRIGDLGNLDKGVSYKGAFLTDEGMPMINLGCFQGKGKFKIENLKTYSGEYKERHTVKPGDIVLANTDITQKREVIGSPAIVPDYPAKEYLFTHHTYALRLTDNSPVLKNYLYFRLLQEEFRERAEGYATGTTVLALPRDAVLDYEISMPPADLLQKFYEQVHPMFQKVQSNIKESRMLGSLRDSLLPKLMRGEVRVSEL